jgi:hypothetical protein
MTWQVEASKQRLAAFRHAQKHTLQAFQTEKVAHNHWLIAYHHMQYDDMQVQLETTKPWYQSLKLSLSDSETWLHSATWNYYTMISKPQAEPQWLGGSRFKLPGQVSDSRMGPARRTVTVPVTCGLCYIMTRMSSITVTSARLAAAGPGAGPGRRARRSGHGLLPAGRATNSDKRNIRAISNNVYDEKIDDKMVTEHGGCYMREADSERRPVISPLEALNAVKREVRHTSSGC